MTLRRAITVVATILLVLLSIAVSEAALFALLLVFSSILRLQVNFQLGEHILTLWTNVRAGPYVPMPTMTLEQGGIVASAVFSFACAVVAAARRYRWWMPA